MKTKQLTNLSFMLIAIKIALGGCGSVESESARTFSRASPDETVSVTCTWTADTTATFVSDPLVSTTPGVFAGLISVGKLSFNAGGYLTCDWTNKLHTNLILQRDGNFALFSQPNGTNGKTWAANTKQPDNPDGPGTTASFQPDANLVVRNTTGKAIWASNTHTYPLAVLAFQSDGNLVIYNHVGTAYDLLWTTATE